MRVFHGMLLTGEGIHIECLSISLEDAFLRKRYFFKILPKNKKDT